MMQTPKMTGHNIEITDAMRARTEEKLNKRLAPFSDSITSIHIIFDVDKSNHMVEGIIHIPNNSIHAKAEGTEMYTALDDLIDKIVKQLRKHKEKMKDHHRREARKAVEE
jgi:putative sigma-54 modulation protein